MQSSRVVADWYSSPFVAQYSPGLTPAEDVRYCDLVKFDLLNTVMTGYNVPEYELARNATNPYESLGKLGYINRAAVKLAEIDTDYLSVVTPSIPGSLSISRAPTTFADIAGGPGGFTQYLQHKYPQIVGYGITLPGDLTWRLDKLDTKRFTALLGDLYIDWQAFRDAVLTQHPRGVDLVVADGGFEVETTADHGDVQEAQSSRLLIIEANLGLSLTKIGGNFVLKVFGTTSPLMVDLLYVLSLGFERVALVKPRTSRPANAERYLLCMQRRNNTIDLSAVRDANLAGMRLDVGLPSDYVDWITKHNNLSLDLRLRSAKKIYEYLACKNVDLSPPMDINALVDLRLK